MADTLAIQLTGIGSQHTIEMSLGVFGRLLHLACSQGWIPEGIPTCWPRKSWDTELVLRDLKKSMEGCLSEYDAHGLGRALRRLMAVDGLSYDNDLYIAASRLLDLVDEGALRVTERTKPVFMPS